MSTVLNNFFLNSENAPLKINKETGALKLTGRPEGKAYQFVIKALDNGYPGREDSAAVRINVISPEEQVLKFDRASFVVRIAESTPSGYRVADMHAGTGRKVKYQLIDGNLPSSNATGVFTIGINSGAIHLTGKLDFETVPSYNLLVKASEVGNAAANAFMHVTVMIENVNDNAPVFDSKIYDVTIAENIPVNTKIVQVSAIDADDPEGTQLRYRFVKSTIGADGSSLFAIGHHTGIIKTISKLDTKTKSSYEIEVIVQDGRKTDKKRFNDTTKVRITVLDTNNSPPVFVSGRRRFSVREDHVIGEKVAAVLAQDRDKDSRIRYYIVKGNELGRFEVDEMTGEIKLIAKLDRETISRYSLTVLAYDGVFTATVDLTIIVTDTNDNSPSCMKAFYSINVMESTQTRPIVAKIEATDPDTDDRLVYSLQGDGFGKFLVNERTGEFENLLFLQG